MSKSIYEQLNQTAKKFELGTLQKEPMFVSNTPNIKIGVIVFDPQYFICTSDMGVYYNLYESYMENIEPTVSKLQHQLRESKKCKRMAKNESLIRHQLDIEKQCRNNYKIEFFNEIICNLWSKYDIIFIEGLDSLLNVSGSNNFRGNPYPGQKILSKPYFKEFLTALQFSNLNYRINKLVYPIDLAAIKIAHNTCHNCGTIFNSLAYNQESKWLCNKCGLEHIEGINTAINLRFTYFDLVANKTPLYGLVK